MNYDTHRYTALRRALHERTLVLDGSLGVMIQRLGLSESQYRGHFFLTHPRPLSGDVDVLCLTAPGHVSQIHRAYLEAGADIIETNTFNSNSLSQAEYGLEAHVERLNREGARIARAEAARMESLNPSRLRFVAGSMGPTAMSASLPCDVDDPSRRGVGFDALSEAAARQAGALIDGGVDAILLETTFDLLNAKAQLHGIRRAMAERGVDVPLFVSVTLSDASGRMLSGHTPEAFLTAIRDFHPDAVGLNCGSGPASAASHLRELASVSPYPLMFYPNAGLPDRLGRYDETPESFTEAIRPLLADGLISIAGGCCGTGPDHIAALAREVAAYPRHKEPAIAHRSAWLAGLEAFHDDRGFINVGERCNVAGSRKFLRLISEHKHDEALAIARRQVEDGAQILDINLDDGMLDSVDEMEKFLRLLGSDPLTSSVPWMIDSSSFEVIETALRNVGGKPVVNSISLKHGEEEFLRQAAVIGSCGAAVVVMAFDENGQADTYERRIRVCERAYRLLTEKAGFDPRDIIFDPNVLTVATGIPEHDSYALDFIRAVRWIKQNLPGAKTSGGISNLSFAFRGNNYLRQAMHAVFLYHAIAAGLDMAIMDPGTKVTYDAIPADLLERLEDVVLCRRPDATERLAAVASDYASGKVEKTSGATASVSDDVDERLAGAMLSGDDSRLEDDLREAVGRCGGAVAVVEGPLMAGMERVGKLFEGGRIFLPQVVKSARVMHRAVELLRPLLEANAGSGAKRGVFLTATVKGDVHDIGKNIVNVVMRCNNYEVVDLGVQVEADRIVAEAKRLHPDIIGLSGLISPSLEEMGVVADALSRAGITIPLLVGGAATSELHTAVKIAPRYAGTVVRVSDAAQNPVVAARLMADPEGEALRVKKRQQELRDSLLDSAQTSAVSEKHQETDWASEPIDAPAHPGVTELRDIPVSSIRPYINWIYFFNCWRTPAGSAEGASLRENAEKLLDRLEAEGATMQAMVAILPAHSTAAGDAIVINGVEVPTPRQKSTENRKSPLALCDFVAPEGYGDHAGVFVTTIGPEIRTILEKTKAAGDDYACLLLQSVCDRLAEASSEWLHHKVRTEIWGYASDEDSDPDRILHGRYRGIRPAVGYPSLPDQKLMHTLARLLDMGDVDVTVTENGALSPSSSVAGFYLASPRSRYFTV